MNPTCQNLLPLPPDVGMPALNLRLHNHHLLVSPGERYPEIQSPTFSFQISREHATAFIYLYRGDRNLGHLHAKKVYMPKPYKSQK